MVFFVFERVQLIGGVYMSNTDDKTFLLGCMGSIALFILLWMITGNPILAFIIGGGVALVTSWYAKRKKQNKTIILINNYIGIWMRLKILKLQNIIYLRTKSSWSL